MILLVRRYDFTKQMHILIIHIIGDILIPQIFLDQCSLQLFLEVYWFLTPHVVFCFPL